MDHPRKRKGRACDQCRKSKSRCEDATPPGADRPCRNCIALDTECTYNEPVRKRGPPKGYMNALEQRLSNAEGLLAAIICSNDSRAMSLISDLSTDALANHIIERVREGEFGLGGRASRESAPAPKPLANERSSEPHPVAEASPINGEINDRPLISKLDEVFTQPTLEWQDCLNLRLALGSRAQSSKGLSTNHGQESRPSETELSLYRHSSLQMPQSADRLIGKTGQDTRSRYSNQRESQSKSPPPIDDDVESMDTEDQNGVLDNNEGNFISSSRSYMPHPLNYPRYSWERFSSHPFTLLYSLGLDIDAVSSR